MTRSTSSNDKTSQYRQMLLERRDAVLTGLGSRAVDFSRASRVADEDLAQESHDEFVSLRLNSLEYLQFRQVQEALDRLQAGDFGLCLSCEQPIPAKRLQVLPWAKYCVKCQERVAEQAGSREVRLELDE